MLVKIQQASLEFPIGKHAFTIKNNRTEYICSKLTLLAKSATCGICLYFARCSRTFITPCKSVATSPYSLLSFKRFSLSTPSTSICKWFNVVIDVVKFLLAASSCLMSRVISFTLVSDSAALDRMSLNLVKSSLIDS